MKTLILAAAAIAVTATTAFAQSKPAPMCEHVEVLWDKVEREWNMRQWPQERNEVAGIWQDRNGTKWVFENDGEEACLKKFKAKK